MFDFGWKMHIFANCYVFQRKKSESIFVCNIDSVIICCWKRLCIWIYTSSIIWTGWKPRFHRFFEDFKGRKDALIVCAVSTPPLFFFGNCRKKDFNCLRSIGSPVFLLWKCLISGERCIFSRIVTYFKERKVSRFLFAISTASLYAAENDYVFGSRRRPYERS